jgi:signal peptidase I
MDNGPQLSNKINKRLMQLLNIHILFTTPYSSQENAIVERKFREIRRHLGHLVRADKTLPWSSRVKAVQRIINSQSGTLGVSPADLKFGKPHVLSTNILVSASPPAAVAEPDYVAKLQQAHAELSEQISKELLRRANDKLLPESAPTFDRGDWVWVEKATRLKSDVSNSQRDGPFEVESQIGNTVVLKDNRFLREKRVNISRCTKYNGNIIHPAKARVEVQTSVLEADKEYIAEAILDHFPKAPAPIRLQGTKVLVKWLGYEGEDTWEYIDGDIRRTPQFAEYAKNFSDLAKFIPRDSASRNSSTSAGGTGKHDSKRRGATRR